MSLALLAVVTAGGSLALNNLTNLGRPTNDTPQKYAQYFPTDGFQRMGISLRRGGKVEVFVGDASWGRDVYLWPLVKALSQFGVLSGASPVDRRCYEWSGTKLEKPLYICDPPTFNLNRAHFRSRYVYFVLRRVLGTMPGSPYSTVLRLKGLSGPERAAVRFGRSHGLGTQAESYPLTVVGRYAQTGSRIMTPGVLEGYEVHNGSQQLVGLPFSVIQQSLQRGRPVDSRVSPYLIGETNAEVNLLVALVCHQDGMWPKRVCSRSVVRGILRHVK